MNRNRKIGPRLATLLVANNMIGSGIFLLPATLATVGSITIVGWLLATNPQVFQQSWNVSGQPA